MQQVPHPGGPGSRNHSDGPQFAGAAHCKPRTQWNHRHHQEGGTVTRDVPRDRTGMVNQQSRYKRSQKIGCRRPNGQPAEHPFEFCRSLSGAANVTLQSDRGRTRGAAGHQGTETQHGKHGECHGQTCTHSCRGNGQPDGPLESILVSITPRRQREKNLGQ